MASYHYGTSGQVYYAKPEPLVASPWGGDAIVGVENGSTGSFAFTLDPTKQYVVYQRIGGSPAITDTNVGSFLPSVQSQCEAAIVAQDVDRLNAFRPRAI